MAQSTLHRCGPHGLNLLGLHRATQKMPYAQLTGLETVKVYLSNFPVMDLLEWLVKSTQSSIHLHIIHASQLSNRLFKIGKGQLSAGIIGYFQCPEMTKHLAGGNDQVQRGAMLTGGSKNDHAAVARSDILTVAYVATTQTLPHHRINYDYRASDTTTHPAPPPEQPDTVTSKPSSRSRYSTHAR